MLPEKKVIGEGALTLSPRIFSIAVLIGLLVAIPATLVRAHGDVTPQPIDTAGLEPLGEAWRQENPYSGDAKAIEIGSSGYNQNCARCHGLEVISGGLAPDLRYLEKGKPGDEWFIERIRHGAKNQDGTTTMPAFEGTFSQEAMWAIRAFIESKHED
jgi:cytochrome c-550 PedF